MKSKLHRLINFTLIISLFLTTANIFESCKKSTDNNPSNTQTSASTNEIVIQNTAFNPGTISISANTTIKWTNKDGVTQTVTSNEGLFDSGPIVSGETFSFTFPSKGTFSYKCTIHTTMKGSVSVN